MSDRTKEKEEARRARRERALAARPEMTPSAPAPDRVRLATWNLNSLRVRLPALLRFLDRTRPDVVLLQETRGAQASDEAVAALDERGYVLAHLGTGGHNGVAIASRHPIRDVEGSGELGVEVLDREPRLIAGTVDLPTATHTASVRVASVYVPHGRTVDHWHFAYKLDFVAALAERTATWSSRGHVVVAGDVNIAATNSDVFHPDAFVGATHVTPAERAALTRLFDVGLVDVDVQRWGPRARRLTWWKPGFG